jgi:pyruvate dehydrogenase E2 component (dihydrolipoamide acetyltransferase)
MGVNPMATEFKLPSVGENVEKVGIVRVLVAEGDPVEKGQSVLEIETDKATLEVPVNVSGRVASIQAKAGQEVHVGQVILTIDTDVKGAAPRSKGRLAPAAAVQPPTAPAKPLKEQPRQAARAEDRQEAASASAGPAADPSPAVAAALEEMLPLALEVTVPAAPSVRRLAREIGVDIGQVRGSGPGGRIGADDVKASARRRAESPAGGGIPAPPPLPDFAQWGEVERQPLSNIRRVISKRLGYAWVAIPHVHQHDKADVTDLEAFRRQVNERAGESESKLTMTAILLKLLAALLRRHPQFNASYDVEREELVLKRYYGIGVAVDTPRGLVVPVVRDVDKKSLRELAAELETVAARAREGKLTPDDMKGGTFTLSNLGGIGGTSFSPIINHPEVAILGVARAQTELALVGGHPVERLMLPLCLAYDHRVIDGADGARFITELTQALSNPYHLLLLA